MLSLQVNMLFFSYGGMHWLLLGGQNAKERKLMMKASFGLRAAEVSIRRGGEGVAEQPKSRQTGSRGRNGRCGVTFQDILEWPSSSSQVPEFLQPLKKGPPAGNQVLDTRSYGDHICPDISHQVCLFVRLTGKRENLD